MNLVNDFRNWTIGALVLLFLLLPVGVVQGQNTAHLTVTLTGQTLTAGFNNTVNITATNSYSSGSVYPSNAIYDVDLAVSVPTPLQMLGDNHWHYDSIALQQSVTLSFQVYAPTTAIGNSYQGSVSLTYRQLGDISYTQEIHDVGFSVRGWISLKLYGVQLTPSVTSPGGNVTISGNLLNSGNIAAYNANVTIESKTLALGSTASIYLGEVDPNIPRPFSLLVSFKKDLPEGNYSITVNVSAIDTGRPTSPYNAQQVSEVQIRKPVVQPPSEGQQRNSGLVGVILEIVRYLWSVFFGWTTLPSPLWLPYPYLSAPAAFICVCQAG